MRQKDKSVYKIAMTGLLAALSYVAFTFLQIKIMLPGGDATSFHLGNTICVLGALLAGTMSGSLGGAIGMTIGDLLDPVYVIYAPKTFLLKMLIGLIAGGIAHGIGHINNIAGGIAHGIGHINQQKDRGKILRLAVIASVCGLGFNVIADPLLGYVYKVLIIGQPAAQVALTWNFITTGSNAVISAVAAVILYMALRPVFAKAGLLPES